LAVLVGGAAVCASLAMTVAPVNARPISTSVGAGSTEPGVLAADELSSRRHGAGSRHSYGAHHAGRHHGGGGYSGPYASGYGFGDRSFKHHPRSAMYPSAASAYGGRSFKSRGYGSYGGYGFGDRSFKHHPRSAMYPSAASAYGDRSSKSRGHGGGSSGGRNYVGFGPHAYW
jgi:hypothetical protein